ncbi:ferritin [Enterococcus hirae]|jgi:ferritin|nr:ferritin [Enterococcaceae bacterium]MCI1919797.1 ferritin [Enterococcaceae bacterium]MDM8213777.1 ferritin [Enterococcus hirae]
MLDQKVADLLNTQIEKELYSAYLYLDFANYFEAEGLDGFANWYTIQTMEERDHAMLIRQYMLNNDCKVKLLPIDAPASGYKNYEEPLKGALEHEEYVTKLINTIYTAAQEAKDYRTIEFLTWFVKEQGEEEKNANDMIRKYELFGTDPKGLYALNTELRGRVYAAPSLVLD